MIKATTIQQLKLARERLGSPLVLVPTMGALHRGHQSLIEHARRTAGSLGSVAVSIFVNPIQFDRPEDLDSYPSTLESDLTICQELGVDLVFHPPIDEVYQADRSVAVSEATLSNQLCGLTRPGHFDGVCTVVTKLFNLFQPTHAVFGKKDFQQLAIIRRMVRDLNIPVHIVAAETVRHRDGLACSSRNAKLTEINRQQAPILSEALVAAKNAFEAGERSAIILKSLAENIISSAPTVPRIDYIECVNAETLQTVETITAHSVLAIATFFGQVRLIDNIELIP